MGALAAARVSSPSPKDKRLLWIALAAAAVAAIAFALVLLWPGGSGNGIVNVGHVDAFAVGSVTTNDDAEFHLVRLSENDFLAFSWHEPGRDCTVPWRPSFEWGGSTGWFRAGCTGSTFDRSGHLIFGPAARDLDRYVVTVLDGDVIVDTNTYVCGYAPPGDPCTEAPSP